MVLLDLFALDGVLRSKLLVQVVDLLGDLLVLGLAVHGELAQARLVRVCSVRKLAVELLTRFRELRVQLGAQVTEVPRVGLDELILRLVLLLELLEPVDLLRFLLRLFVEVLILNSVCKGVALQITCVVFIRMLVKFKICDVFQHVDLITEFELFLISHHVRNHLVNFVPPALIKVRRIIVVKPL